MIQAILFDFDGLILDTEYPEFLAWSEQYAKFGLNLALEDWVDTIGRGASTRTWSPYSDLERLLGDRFNCDALRAAKRARFAELMCSERPLPGVEALIESACERGIKRAVVSSSPRSWVSGFLTEIGLNDAFDLICCGDEIVHTKPEPDLYLAALTGLGINAKVAVALEDSTNGIAAAKAAGVCCVAVPNRITRQTDLSGADAIVDSLEGVTLERLSELVTERIRFVRAVNEVIEDMKAGRGKAAERAFADVRKDIGK